MPLRRLLPLGLALGFLPACGGATVGSHPLKLSVRDAAARATFFCGERAAEMHALARPRTMTELVVSAGKFASLDRELASRLRALNANDAGFDALVRAVVERGMAYDRVRDALAHDGERAARARAAELVSARRGVPRAAKRIGAHCAA